MHNQNKAEPYEASDFFADGRPDDARDLVSARIGWL